MGSDQPMFQSSLALQICHKSISSALIYKQLKLSFIDRYLCDFHSQVSRYSCDGRLEFFKSKFLFICLIFFKFEEWWSFSIRMFSFLLIFRSGENLWSRVMIPHGARYLSLISIIDQNPLKSELKIEKYCGENSCNYVFAQRARKFKNVQAKNLVTYFLEIAFLAVVNFFLV